MTANDNNDKDQRGFIYFDRVENAHKILLFDFSPTNQGTFFKYDAEIQNVSTLRSNQGYNLFTLSPVEKGHYAEYEYHYCDINKLSSNDIISDTNKFMKHFKPNQDNKIDEPIKCSFCNKPLDGAPWFRYHKFVLRPHSYPDEFRAEYVTYIGTLLSDSKGYATVFRNPQVAIDMGPFVIRNEEDGYFKKKVNYDC